jgi:hypothetical protein
MLRKSGWLGGLAGSVVEYVTILSFSNVPYGFASYTASRATFTKPLPKPLYFGAKQPTLALYRVLQPKILFRVYIYYLLIRTRIIPSLITLPAAPLS